MMRRVLPLASLFVVLALLLGLLLTELHLTAAAAAGDAWRPGRDSRPGVQAQDDGRGADSVSFEWDDADSHKWIGEPWGTDIDVGWVSFQGRDSLRAQITSGAPNWALIRTDSFPPEDWSEWTGLRADIYQAGGASNIDVKLEVRGIAFDDLVEALYCWNLQPNSWNTCTWIFSTERPGYGAVSHVSMVFDYLGGSAPTFYVDNLRLVSTTGEEEWDDMDDGSRWWFYFGNWYDWNPATPFGLEPITHLGVNPRTPSGSAYLEWDHPHGVDPTVSSAELGTNRLGNRDWSGYTRLSADVKISDSRVPLSVFFWDEEGSTTPEDCRGFGTPVRRVRVDDTWQTMTWDLPWPPCFNNTDIDEVKFVANHIDEHQVGSLYVDNLSLIPDVRLIAVIGLSYVLEDFNDRKEWLNDFQGPYGELNGDQVTLTLDTSVYRGPGGASLRVDYALPEDTYAGVWHSLWGHPDYTQTQYLDLTDLFGDLNEGAKDVEQIQFWVRGSGATSGRHNVKVELKDNTGDYERTAYRYITIDDSDTTWRRIVLDADVTNSSFWSYNLDPPDPTRMKQLVLVLESYFNDGSGTFYIDDMHLVDADDSPFDTGQPTDEFLDLVSKKTFQYFLDWYDPNTGLYQDRSIYPDLMSIASTGFGLTALTIGESRDWIERTLAIEMITRTLHTLDEGQSAGDTVTDTISRTNGYKGFYYHFLDNDGLRTYNEEKGVGSELSSVDTAILLAGVLTAREYFHDVPEIRELADRLYERVEWDWMLDPANHQFYLAWKPEEGDDNYPDCAPGEGCFSRYHWDYYTDEVILINLLAIGSPSHPVPVDVFYAWERVWGTYGGHTLVQSWNGSLFTYVFAHLWIDFRGLGEDHHPDTPVDWWENSVEAAWANWQFAVDHHDDTACDGDDDYTTYGEESWGLTAAENPCPGDKDPYHAYGAPPPNDPGRVDHDGTIPPYGAGMSTMLLPEKAIPALEHYFESTDLWRYRFGFGDAYNLDPSDCDGPCYNHAAFGIDQGPMLIGIDNYRSGMVWETVGRNAAIRRALCLVWGACAVIDGPNHGLIDTSYPFTATVVLPTATEPVTYVWQATGHSPVTHTGGLSDTIDLAWDTPGRQMVTVTATSAEGAFTDTHALVVYGRYYLPLVAK